MFTLLRCFCRTLVLIGSGYFCDLLTLYLLLYLYMIEKTDGILLNTRDHFIEHIKSGHLVFYKRIHPLAVDHLQQYDTLQLTELLDLREFGLFCFI